MARQSLVRAIAPRLSQSQREGRIQSCPRILVLTGAYDFTLYRITLKNSPNFHVSYSGGNGFTPGE